MNKAKMNRRLPHEETVSISGTEVTVRVKGPGDDYLACRYLTLSIDEGLADSGARGVLDVQVQVIPENHPQAMGLNIWHTLGAQPRPADDRHHIPLGFDLKPNEDVLVKIRRGNGGAADVQLRLERIGIRDSSTKVDGAYLGS